MAGSIDSDYLDAHFYGSSMESDIAQKWAMPRAKKIKKLSCSGPQNWVMVNCPFLVWAYGRPEFLVWARGG